MKKRYSVSLFLSTTFFFRKSGCSLKKKKRSSLRFYIRFPYLSLKIRVFPKKKRSSLRFYIRFPYFSLKIRVFSKKKKKRSSSLRFYIRFPYFSLKSGFFSKKKKGLHFDFISDFPISLPKSGCLKKVLNRNRSLKGSCC